MAHAPPTPAARAEEDAARARRVELILAEIDALPTLSSVAARVAQLGDAGADAAELTRLVESDPALTTRVLALCRRADKGLGDTVTTVKRAVVMLGAEAIRAAVLSVEIYEMFRPRAAAAAQPVDAGPAADAAPEFDRVGFWRHALAVACASEALARAHSALHVRPEEAFVAGLVHDLGKLALERIVPRAYRRVLELAEQRQADLATVERAVLGIDHLDAGRRLAERWRLPALLTEAMWLHAQLPDALGAAAHAPAVTLVGAADALARALHLGWSGSQDDPPTIEVLAARYALDPQRIRSVLPTIHEALSARSRDLGLGSETPPQILLEAIASAGRRLARRSRILEDRNRAAGRAVRTVDALAALAVASARAASLPEALGAVARSAGLLATPAPAPIVALAQPRAGDPWLLVRIDAAGAVESTDAFPRPAGADGPVDLAPLAEQATLEGAAAILAVVKERLGTDALRGLRLLLLRAPEGTAAAALLHTLDLSEKALGKRTWDALRNAWCAAIGAAAERERAARQNTRLADSSRALALAQARVVEAQAMARLGEMTAGAAHEINTPLAVICGRAQLLAARLADPRDRDDARAIAQAATDLSALITRLHELATPGDARRAPVDLAPLIDDAVRAARERTGCASSPVRVAVPQNLPQAMLDRELIARALAEVVANAFESGSSETVDIAVRTDDPDGRLLITVTDAGRGLSPHALQHAFDPFFSDRPAGRRTGLGLPAARRCLGLHAGSVTIRTREGAGTTVTLAVPQWRVGTVDLPSAA